MSLKFAALGSLTILSALGPSPQADDKGLVSLFPDAAQWGGYRSSKAIAWVIDVGVNKPAWLARYRDQVCGPLSLKQAKATALAMAKGAAADYRIEYPIAHLNGLAARLLDTASSGPTLLTGVDRAEEARPTSREEHRLAKDVTRLHRLPSRYIARKRFGA